MKFVFKNGQGIQTNEENTTYYIVQKDVETDDPNEVVTVKVMSVMGNPYTMEVKVSVLANLCEKYDTWFTL